MHLEIKSKSGENLVILAVIFLTVLIVLVVTYSVYLFIELTHVSNAADVHVTKSLLMAARGAQGKLYSNAEKGIINWVVYEDEGNGFEIKYPSDMDFQTSLEHLLTLKKFNAVNANGLSSLSLAVYLDVKDVPDDMSLKAALGSMGIAWNDSWKQQDFGGKSGIRTGEIKDSSGVIKDTVFWQFNGKIFSLEGDFFNSKSLESEKLFNNIVSEFRFM